MYSDEKDYVNFLFESGIFISNESVGNKEPLPGNVLQNQNWEFINSEHKKHNYVVIDNFLKPEYALRLRDFVLYINKRHDYYGEYAAINFQPEQKNYLWFSLLSNIVIESLLNIECLKTTSFNRAWAFIYNEICRGIPPHIDTNSDITLNLWVTPNDCLVQEKEQNGLVIYESLKEIVVPYEFNRLVIFNSATMHKSQNVVAKTGYKNKRINYTFLFKKFDIYSKVR